MDYQTKIANFYKNNHRMPSNSEIMRLVGFKSKSSAFKLVTRLVKAGVIEKDNKGFLIPKKLFGGVRVLGMIQAGFPSPAEEELVDTMSLDDWLIKNKEATYMLRVKGDSMIEAGIMEGDMVLVDRSRTPQNGDVVLASLDGAWTMKYLSKKNGRVALVPANKKYKPIVPTQDQELTVAAVVIAVIRKYHV